MIRRPPRSTPKPASRASDVNTRPGIGALARMTDKARAAGSNSLGEYWYGEDSGIDRKLLTFLEISAQNFVEAVQSYPTDVEFLNWLNRKKVKTDTEIKIHNEEIINVAPTTERQRIFLEKAVNKLAPHRTDIGTFFDLMVLEDEKSFEYWNL